MLVFLSLQTVVLWALCVLYYNRGKEYGHLRLFAFLSGVFVTVVGIINVYYLDFYLTRTTTIPYLSKETLGLCLLSTVVVGILANVVDKSTLRHKTV